MRQYYRAQHILLEDEDDAKEIVELLSKGRDFSELAREYSECDSGKDGGDLGKFATGAMIPDFEKALYLLEIDQVSRPIKTEFGYHLIKRLAL